MSEILTNFDFIKSIDKVITGLGATPSSIPLTPDQANDMVDKIIFDSKMTELAAAVPSEGGGGGGISTLILEEDVEPVEENIKHTLNHTAREIIEAMPHVYLKHIEEQEGLNGVETLTAYIPIQPFGASHDRGYLIIDNAYVFTFSSNAYVAETIDDYPIFIELLSN